MDSGASPGKGDQADQRNGAALLGGKAEGIGIVRPGQEKPLG